MNTRNLHRQAGFNLLELMITVMIAAMVLGFGIPSLNQFIDSNRMAAAANDFVTSIHTARTEAVKRRALVTLCSSTDWAAANPTCDAGGWSGWIVFFDADGNANVNGADTVVLTHGPLATGVGINTGGARYLQYGGDGFPRTAGVLPRIADVRLCDRRGSVATGGGIAAGRWIHVEVTGRPQLHRAQAEVLANPIGACP